MGTLMTQDVNAIRSAADQYGIPIPKAAADAEKLAAAAISLLAEVRAEQAPSLDGLDVKNLRATHQSMVARGTHGVREQAAEALVQRAEGKRMAAWSAACTDLCDAFRAPFDRAARDFETALDALGGRVNPEVAIKNYQHAEHRQLVAAAADLTTLAEVRNSLVPGLAAVDVGQAILARLGRVLTLPDKDTVSRVIPVRSDGQREYTIEWFAMLLTIPGVRIEWHAPAEQQTWLSLPTQIDGSSAYTASASA